FREKEYCYSKEENKYIFMPIGQQLGLGYDVYYATGIYSTYGIGYAIAYTYLSLFTFTKLEKSE
ncbi:MAG: hypothetical protein AAF518_16825, partial [Spirochaetota bacterium]